MNLTQLYGETVTLLSTIKSTQNDMDQFYTQVMGIQVFMMQCGFAFLEAGCVETKNVTNILMKNIIDTVVVGIVWYLWAFALAFGDEDGAGNGFIGTRYAAFSNMGYDDTFIGMMNTRWYFQFTFAAASTTIVSGSIAARARFPAYAIFSFFYGGWIYPVAAHWVWSNTGWLNPVNPYRALPSGAIDYAGSGIVHLMGGTAALVGAWVIGPRTGRFSPDWDGDKPGTLRTFRSLWSGLGTFLLWYGWYGFNPGSSLHASGASLPNSLACINTTLAACFGAVASTLLQYILRRNWDLVRLCNGILSGLVAITAGCAVVQPWAAVIIGIISGFVYYGASVICMIIRIDDPVEATSVHFLNGLWGLVAVGLFADSDAVTQAMGISNLHYGALMGGGGMLLGVEILSGLTIIAWSAFWSFLVFSTINYFGYLRVTPEVEKMGLDLEHVEMTEQQKRFLQTGPYKYREGGGETKNQTTITVTNSNGGGGSGTNKQTITVTNSNDNISEIM